MISWDGVCTFLKDGVCGYWVGEERAATWGGSNMGWNRGCGSNMKRDEDRMMMITSGSWIGTSNNKGIVSGGSKSLRTVDGTVLASACGRAHGCVEKCV